MFSLLTNVNRSLDALLKLHPYAASGAVARSERADRDSAAIWDQLESAGARRAELIIGLSRVQESLAIYGASSRLNANTLDVLADLFRLRSPRKAGKLAWQCLLLSDGRDEFRQSAVAYLSRLNRDDLVPIAHAARTMNALAATYGASADRFEIWFRKQRAQHTAVKRQTMRLLLSKPFRSRVIDREGIDEIDNWLQTAFVDSERIEWFRFYLIDANPHMWPANDAVMGRIISRFGEPSEHSFWQTIPDRVIAAVKRWLLDASLTEFLGEGERVEFWRNFLDRMIDAAQSRERTAVFVCFDGWFAIQFKEMGRATYMFHTRYFRRLRYLDDTTLYQTILDNRAYAGGRYTHQGYHWQWRARSEVNGMFTRYGP